MWAQPAQVRIQKLCGLSPRCPIPFYTFDLTLIGLTKTSTKRYKYYRISYTQPHRNFALKLNYRRLPFSGHRAGRSQELNLTDTLLIFVNWSWKFYKSQPHQLGSLPKKWLTLINLYSLINWGIIIDRIQSTITMASVKKIL